MSDPIVNTALAFVNSSTWTINCRVSPISSARDNSSKPGTH